MTDKDRIKQEIKKEMSLLDRTNRYDIGRLNELNHLLLFIDSLPEELASEDLEEYYTKEFLPKEWFAKPGHRTISQFNFFTARHFAEWQKKKDQETIELAEDHAMLAGMNRMKEEMMKDAVEAFVNIYENTDDSNYVEFVTEQSPYKFKETEKCKIIIVKEE